jgi:hypothetical protein
MGVRMAPLLRPRLTRGRVAWLALWAAGAVVVLAAICGHGVLLAAGLLLAGIAQALLQEEDDGC